MTIIIIKEYEYCIFHYLDHGNLSSSQPSSKDERVCKVPKLNLKITTVKDVYRKLPNLNCKGNQLFYLQDSVLRWNRTVLGVKKITRWVYRAVERLNDRSQMFSEPLMKKDNFEAEWRTISFLSSAAQKTIQSNRRMTQMKRMLAYTSWT